MNCILGNALQIVNSKAIVKLKKEDGDRRPEVRGRRSEVGGRRSEVGGQRSEVGGQRSEVGDQRSEVRGRGSEVGGLKTEKGDESLSPGMIRMNKMPGWKKPGSGDKVIKAKVRGRRLEVKNKVTTKFDIKIKNTYDLINKIKNNELPDKIMINVHPQRWNDKSVPWFIELVSQNVKNVIKRAMLAYRNTGMLE